MYATCQKGRKAEVVLAQIWADSFTELAVGGGGHRIGRRMPIKGPKHANHSQITVFSHTSCPAGARKSRSDVWDYRVWVGVDWDGVLSMSYTVEWMFACAYG